MNFLPKSYAKGIFQFSGLGSDNYTLEVSREGYVPQTIANVAITDGKLTRLAVVLVKI